MKEFIMNIFYDRKKNIPHCLNMMINPRFVAASKKNKPLCAYLLGLLELDRMSEVIPFDEIVPGASVRVVTIDGLQYLSIRDIIMCVCNKDNNDAGQIWRRMSSDHLSELQTSCLSFQFSGQGQVPSPVITFPGALKLLMFLPGEVAKKHRSAMVNILRRFFAGDMTLLDEIEKNSRSPLAQMAREESLLEQEPYNELDNSLKRKREELELQRMEIQTYKELCTDTTMDERAKQIFKDAILSKYVGDPKDNLKNVPAPTAEIPAGLKPRKVFTNAYIKSLISTKISNDAIATNYFLDYSLLVDNDLMVVPEPAGIDPKEIQVHQVGTPCVWDEFRSIGVSYTGPRVAISRLRGLDEIKEAYGAEVSGIQCLVLVLFRKARIRLNQVLATVSKVVPLKLQDVSVYKQNEPTSDPILAAIKLPSANKWMFRMAG